jgi:hypothetical protein
MREIETEGGKHQYTVPRAFSSSLLLSFKHLRKERRNEEKIQRGNRKVKTFSVRKLKSE